MLAKRARYDSFGGPVFDSLCAVGLITSALQAPTEGVALVLGILTALFVLCMAVLCCVPSEG